MDGILYVVDEQNKRKFVQIDLDMHGELWEDFYDILIADSRKDEESISFDHVKDELKKYGKL
ncbi:MAG TPA: hypothetical protein VFG10_08070 [Saprospiraceae bacterium]|nr:hypothetical protein [Saprospiraceae bacterium]